MRTLSKGFHPYRIYKRYVSFLLLSCFFIMLPTSIYIRIRFGIDSISFKMRVWEARNGYNFIRDDALQVAVCVIAIFLDILYGNLLYVIFTTEKKKKIFVSILHSTNCVGMNKICFSCNIPTRGIVCSQVF